MATLSVAVCAVVCGVWVLPALGITLGFVAVYIASALIAGWLPSSIRLAGDELTIRPRLMPLYRRDARTLLTVEIQQRRRAVYDLVADFIDRYVIARQAGHLGPSDVIVFNFEDYADNVTLRGHGYRRADLSAIAQAGGRPMLDNDNYP